MAITKRAGKRAQAGAVQQPAKRNGVQKAAFDATKRKEVGVSDLTLLSKVSEEAINDNLKKRFDAGLIYTYIGHVLISVNPFRDLGIYTDAVLETYKGKNRLEVSPHVFAIAEAAYYNMKSYSENQCVIISGESGAGKTEAAKRIMQYIASVSSATSGSIQEIKDMVLATNPLLESFGCAKTLRNNNSSRHGKYLEIQFNKIGEPVGANIINYLLEKNRVVGQIVNERNFHIFYQFTKGAKQQYRETLGIQTPDMYVYTSASKCTAVDGIDDVKDYAETLRAMEVIGLQQAEQDDIFKILAIILWLGNVDFVENQDGNADIRDPSVPNFVAYLMDVDATAVVKALTIRIMETSRGGRRGSVYEVPLNVTQARAVRDALAKGIYSNLFDWIVERVNVSMRTRGEKDKTIGILDIYGFEIFENNSFEQICINYVNEKLQQIFIQLTLKTEQDEYVREQIKWTPINYFNNKIVCDLIEEKRPPGIFAALNDACATAHADSSAADSSFIQRLSLVASNPHFEQRQAKFVIKHYAGDVMYTVAGMTDKNKDQLLKDLLDLVAMAGNSFLNSLFPNQVDPNSKRRPPTASDKIKASAGDLVNTLMQCQPSYIRTIKPNQSKSPTEFDVKAVLHQIKYLGLQENVRIRRAGFAYRQTFEKFTERFYLLSSKTSYAGDYIWTGDSRSAVLQILNDTGIPKEEYQMGVSKAFIKTPETLFALEHMRDRYWHNMAARIQRAWRRYLAHKIECAIKIQRLWRKVNGTGQYTETRDYGHQVLAQRKERRSMSLIGSRRFLGDYLGIDNRGGPGEFLRNSTTITPKEMVHFSCRGEQLVAKLGRTSQRLPKVFVLTNKAFYIISESVVNRQLQILTERTIPIGQIQYVALSNLRDDWFAISTGSASEPDPFLWCVFKTELVTRLKMILPNLNLRIGPTVEYNKKPGKKAIVKFQKDPAVARDDTYKSSVVHVPPGERPNSVSRPMPRRKNPNGSAAPAPRPVSRAPPPAAPRAAPAARPASRVPPPPPATQPKAARARPPPPPAAKAKPAAPRPPASRPVPSVPQAPRPNGVQPVQQVQPVPVPVQPVQVQPTPAARPVPATPVQARPAARAPPPPPPPPAAQPPPPAEPTYRAMFDFAAQGSNQLSIAKGDLVLIVHKENNGWWLAKKPGTAVEGWTPSAYLEEAAAAPAPLTPVSANGYNGYAGAASPQSPQDSTPSSSENLTNVADAIKRRQHQMRSREDDDDDDDDEW
ncbi:P-loop containing nucleoside triphosphate hydrolase protein [Dipodascopsis tothii]|uniref:P-loop containing nucleoside triphosphate hydrolase protein n=1 Tax=Dipodascopsis tothii TaxID=44089 RepID=UPI0034CE9B52